MATSAAVKTETELLSGFNQKAAELVQPIAQDIENFMFATTKGDLNLLQGYYDKYGAALLDAYNKDGVTALYHAVEWTNRVNKSFGFLVGLGADINKAKVGSGITPLMRAFSLNKLDKAHILLEKGALTAAQDAEGKIALHYACKNGTAEGVKALLDRDAGLLNCQDHKLRTPLMYAAGRWGYLSAELLLSMGADVSLTDKDGKTAADYAEENDRSDIAALIRDWRGKAIAADIVQMYEGTQTPIKAKSLMLKPSKAASPRRIFN